MKCTAGYAIASLQSYNSEPNKTSQISVVRFNKIFLRWRESQSVTRIKGILDDFGLS